MEIVSLRLIPQEPYQLLDLALHGRMKDFLHHRHCVRFMDLEWVGNFSGSTYEITQTSAWGILREIIYRIVFPFPLLKAFSRAQLKQNTDTMTKISLQARVKVAAAAAEHRRVAFTASGGGLDESIRSSPSAISSVSGPRGCRAMPLAEELSSDSFRGNRDATHSKSATELLGQSKKKVHGMVRDFGFSKRQSTVTFDEASSEGATERERSRLYSFYNTPIVKYFLRALAHLLWLSLYVVVLLFLKTKEQLVRDGPPPFNFVDGLWIFFQAGSWIDQRHMQMRQSHFRYVSKNSFWPIWLLNDLLFVVGFCSYALCLNVSNHDDAVMLYTFYQVMLSLNILVITVLVLPYMSEWKDFGVLTIIIQEMVVDLATWSLLLVLVMLGFSLCLLGFDRVGWYQNPSMERGDNYSSADSIRSSFASSGAFWAPMWVLYGEVDPDAYLSMTESMTGWLVWLFCLVGSVVLVNLLVAMFADTFQKVREASEAEFYFQRYMRVFEYRHIQTVLPPPLNMPYVMYELIIVAVLGLRPPPREPLSRQKDLSDGSHFLRAYQMRRQSEEEARTDRMVHALAAKVDGVQGRLLEADESSKHQLQRLGEALQKVEGIASLQARAVKDLTVQLEALSKQLVERDRPAPLVARVASTTSSLHVQAVKLMVERDDDLGTPDSGCADDQQHQR